MKKALLYSTLAASLLGLAGCQTVPHQQQLKVDNAIISATGVCNFFEPAIHRALTKNLTGTQAQKNQEIGYRLIGLNDLVYGYAKATYTPELAIPPLSVAPNIFIKKVDHYCNTSHIEYKNLPSNVKYTKAASGIYLMSFMYPFTHYRAVVNKLENGHYPPELSSAVSHFMSQEAYRYAIDLSRIDQYKFN
jgi:hypothetical protein